MIALLSFVGAVLGASIVTATVIAYAIFGRHTIWLNPMRSSLRPYRCKTCDGCGVEWLDPADSVWKPIPRELRIFDGTRNTWAIDEVYPYPRDASDRIAFNTSPPLGNTRRCHGCNGMMHHWDYPKYRSPN